MSEFSHDRDWKLRVVVDASLSPGQQIAQALHAAIEFTQEHPEITKEWHRLSNSVVCVVATDLHDLVNKCNTRGVAYSIFEEPDMDGRLTAVALEPTRETRRLTSNMPLALRGL